MNLETATNNTIPLHSLHDSTSDLALRAWLQTEEGSQRWSSAHLGVSPEQVSYALRNARADRFGILLTRSGMIIWSRFAEAPFVRLRERYWRAAEEGICLWWEKGTLRVVATSTFFALVRTLPGPQPRQWTRGLPWPGRTH